MHETKALTNTQTGIFEYDLGSVTTIDEYLEKLQKGTAKLDVNQVTIDSTLAITVTDPAFNALIDLIKLLPLRLRQASSPFSVKSIGNSGNETTLELNFDIFSYLKAINPYATSREFLTAINQVALYRNASKDFTKFAMNPQNYESTYKVDLNPVQLFDLRQANDSVKALADNTQETSNSDHDSVTEEAKDTNLTEDVDENAQVDDLEKDKLPNDEDINENDDLLNQLDNDVLNLSDDQDADFNFDQTDPTTDTESTQDDELDTKQDLESNDDSDVGNTNNDDADVIDTNNDDADTNKMDVKPQPDVITPPREIKVEHVNAEESDDSESNNDVSNVNTSNAEVPDANSQSDSGSTQQAIEVKPQVTYTTVTDTTDSNRQQETANTAVNTSAQPANVQPSNQQTQSVQNNNDNNLTAQFMNEFMQFMKHQMDQSNQEQKQSIDPKQEAHRARQKLIKSSDEQISRMIRDMADPNDQN